MAIKANPRSPLFEQYCAFTGKLQKYTRKEAMRVLEKIGGFSERGVTKKTRFLIPGAQIKDCKSNKQLKAEKYSENGQNIELIPENLFYEMLEAMSYGQICMDEWLFRCKTA